MNYTRLRPETTAAGPFNASGSCSTIYEDNRNAPIATFGATLVVFGGGGTSLPCNHPALPYVPAPTSDKRTLAQTRGLKDLVKGLLNDTGIVPCMCEFDVDSVRTGLLISQYAAFC